VKNLAVYNAF